MKPLEGIVLKRFRTNLFPSLLLSMMQMFTNKKADRSDFLHTFIRLLFTLQSSSDIFNTISLHIIPYEDFS
jgi:hypothetical protein